MFSEISDEAATPRAVSGAVGAGPTSFARELDGRPLATKQDVATVLRDLAQRGRLALPLPGHGATHLRFTALTEIAAVDLSLARLCEGHADALAIVSELGAEQHAGTYGVWAADPPGAQLRALPALGGYSLQGVKRYASGASSLDRALVTAVTQDGLGLFDVDLSDPAIVRVSDSWAAVGMANSDSLDVRFEGVFVSHSQLVGPLAGYLARPGFYHGGVGVAACWLGGASGCLRMLMRRYGNSRACDSHSAAHVGAVVAACHAMSATLTQAANAIDADPKDKASAGEQRALLVRSVIEHGCEEVLMHTHRATGSSGLVFDARHARRAADLPVYIRQHHAERDLARLATLSLERDSSSCP